MPTAFFAPVRREAAESRRVPRSSGHRCPVVGRISMDLTVVDITDLPGGMLARGDFAEIIGPTIVDRRGRPARRHDRLRGSHEPRGALPVAGSWAIEDGPCSIISASRSETLVVAGPSTRPRSSRSASASSWKSRPEMTGGSSHLGFGPPGRPQFWIGSGQALTGRLHVAFSRRISIDRRCLPSGRARRRRHRQRRARHPGALPS